MAKKENGRKVGKEKDYMRIKFTKVTDLQGNDKTVSRKMDYGRLFEDTFYFHLSKVFFGHHYGFISEKGRNDFTTSYVTAFTVHGVGITDVNRTPAKIEYSLQTRNTVYYFETVGE